jgi:hypothetical protein
MSSQKLIAAAAQVHCEPKTRLRHYEPVRRQSQDRGDPYPHKRGSSDGRKLSSKSALRKAIFASIKEDLVRQLRLYVQLEGDKDITLTDIDRAIRARWLSI